MKSLEVLEIYSNNIRSLPPHIFDKLTNLWAIDLEGNTLRGLPEGVFDNLPNLQYLFVLDNKLVPEGAESVLKSPVVRSLKQFLVGNNPGYAALAVFSTSDHHYTDVLY